MGVTRGDNALALKFYEAMWRIRLFELKAAELFMAGQMSGNIHTSVGQEATEVGACHALKESDFIVSTHRGHGHCIAKGGESRIMMAELFGKATGYCQGKGGSMHIADVSLGILGANGIVGAGIPIAVGSALASRVKKTDEVTLAFFGDAASNRGTFHEALNMAAAWKLPVVFVCENNLFGVSVDIRRVTSVADIAQRASAYDIPGVVVDGNDVFAVHAAVQAAADRARSGQGPSLIECKTWRHRGHYEGDPQVYKTKEETEAWKARDPIVRLRKEIIDGQMANVAEMDALEARIKAEIEEAVEFAQKSPYPTPDQATTDVYVDDNARSVAR
jgi:acetoin:2,6-dichlorophenolindophenol oxidoreductase subunit alpha